MSRSISPWKLTLLTPNTFGSSFKGDFSPPPGIRIYLSGVSSYENHRLDSAIDELIWQSKMKGSDVSIRVMTFSRVFGGVSGRSEMERLNVWFFPQLYALRNGLPG